MDSTVVQTGYFTSDGTAKQLDVRSDIDWMEVINYTQSATTQTTGRGVMFRWQRGMAAATGIMFTKQDSANALDLETLSSGGFTLLDTSSQAPGAAVTGTTITKANPPVCTAAGHGYSDGDTVRIINSDNMDQINGMEFTIGSVATNTFELSYIDTNTANFTASTSFTVRKIPNQPQFQLRRRYITAVPSTGTTTEVQMSVTHGFSVDEVVRFIVPSDFGMTQLDNLTGKITAVNTTTNTITVDIDSSAFTAFAWPAASSAPLNFAQVVPVGIDGSNSVSDATDNVSFIGMELGAGADGPAGSSSDVIYWRAGKAFSNATS
jgi:hypothetical protein